MHYSFWLAATLGSATTSAIATIESVGSKFFTSDGDQFFIKGMITEVACEEA